MPTLWIPLLLTAAGAAVVERLLPDRAGGASGAVRLLIGLCLLCALLRPLTEGLRLLRELAADGAPGTAAPWDPAEPFNGAAYDGIGVDPEEVFADQLAAWGRTQTEAWALEALDTRFGIPASCASVSAVCTSDGQTVTPTELRIRLVGRAVFTDPHVIEAWFSDALGCPCLVSVG